LYLASLPRISATSNENYKCYNFQAIFAEFLEKLNFQKIHNPSVHHTEPTLHVNHNSLYCVWEHSINLRSGWLTK